MTLPIPPRDEAPDLPDLDDDENEPDEDEPGDDDPDARSRRRKVFRFARVRRR